jgi:hypothetical protein
MPIFSVAIKGAVSQDFFTLIFFMKTSVLSLRLKGQLHKIFDPQFFHQSTPRALIHGLKLLCIWLRIRRANRFESHQIGFSAVNGPAETENEV